jgi:hypothetical protein
VQLVKAALPAGEVELDGQVMHVELPEAPTAVEYVPSPQSVQVTVPVKVLYFPATHAVHGSSFGPVDPAVQVQFVKAALPADEVELDGQTLHRPGPVTVLYFPAEHATHGPPSGPENPALHVQFAKEFFEVALSAGELEFVGQVVHVEVDATIQEATNPLLLLQSSPYTSTSARDKILSLPGSWM